MPAVTADLGGIGDFTSTVCALHFEPPNMVTDVAWQKIVLGNPVLVTLAREEFTCYYGVT